jgi:hypothetical protein
MKKNAVLLKRNDGFLAEALSIPVGAAEGCDLLILLLKIKRSQPSAAPTEVKNVYYSMQIGQAMTASSRASPLPQFLSTPKNLMSTAKPLWEQACSRRGRFIQRRC